MNVNELHNGHGGQQKEQHFADVADAFQDLMIDYKVAYLDLKSVMLKFGM
ncbi:hypothetical protein SDC9_189909 [bioreactor metagenome]|uniref:Uncharacterized protein n=1 Tax=bioreactor metagenome TaxID=1076179 RepID=A0A645HV52_9ZZZZ